MPRASLSRASPIWVSERTLRSIALGAVLARLRADADLGQVEFTRKLGIPQSTYSRMEAGTARPDEGVFRRIVQEGLGLKSIDEFYELVDAVNDRVLETLSAGPRKSRRGLKMATYNVGHGLEALSGLARFFAFEICSGISLHVSEDEGESE